MRKPRGYQVRAINATVAALEKHPSTCISMATGAGKTVVFSILSKLETGRVLVLVHRDELLRQAVKKLMEENPGETIEVEQGERRASAVWKSGSNSGRIVVASKDTLCRDNRLERFPPDSFSKIIVDEGHRCVPKNSTYFKIINRFAVSPIGNGSAKVILVTATPFRQDGEALGSIAKSVAINIPISELIDDGYLVPIRSKRLIIDTIDIDLKNIRLKANEFGEKDLSAGDLTRIANNERYIAQLVKPLYNITNQRDAKPLQAVVFMPSVWSSEQAVMMLNRIRPNCAGVVKGEDFEGRRRVLDGFELGKIQYIVNCDVLTEGWDSDRVDVVVTKPTKSKGKLSQMIGRGTRPKAGCVDIWQTPEERRFAISNSPKPELLVLDPSGTTDALGLVSTVDIFAGTYSPAVITATKAALLAGSRKSIDEELKAAKENQKRLAEERLKEIKVEVTYSLKDTDLFKHFDVKYNTWEPPELIGKPATSGQISYIESKGVKVAPGLSFHKAKKLIEKIVSDEKKTPASPAQQKSLLRFGCDPNISFYAAKKLLGRIFKNNNRRPDDVPEFKG